MTDQNKPGQPKNDEQIKHNPNQQNPNDRQHHSGDKKNDRDKNPEPTHRKE